MTILKHQLTPEEIKLLSTKGPNRINLGAALRGYTTGRGLDGTAEEAAKKLGLPPALLSNAHAGSINLTKVVLHIMEKKTLQSKKYLAVNWKK